MPNATLREIIARLQSIYCGNIGFESTHVFDKGQAPMAARADRESVTWPRISAFRWKKRNAFWKS